jgi:hypothetical protein
MKYHDCILATELIAAAGSVALELSLPVVSGPTV